MSFGFTMEDGWVKFRDAGRQHGKADQFYLTYFPTAGALTRTHRRLEDPLEVLALISKPESSDLFRNFIIVSYVHSMSKFLGSPDEAMYVLTGIPDSSYYRLSSKFTIDKHLDLQPPSPDERFIGESWIHPSSWWISINKKPSTRPVFAIPGLTVARSPRT